MTGCKHSICKILSAAAALFLMLPRIALGEYGICPPYSKTFGPGDPPEDVVSFMNLPNTRPGGVTVRLLPGEYDLTGLEPIGGVLCIRNASETENGPSPAFALSNVIAGGMLTLDGVSVVEMITVESGATLIVERSLVVGARDRWGDDGRPSLRVEAGGFAQLLSSTTEAVENAGVFIMRNGSIDGAVREEDPPERGAPGLDNDGYAFLDQVLIRNALPGFKGAGNPDGVSNSGVISIVGSTISHNGGYDDYLDQYAGVGISNTGFLEINRSIVADNQGYGEPSPIECTGAIVDLGYNVFGPDGGCVITEPTSVEADPLLQDNAELGSGSPAIDRIPLALCSETDMLGRARTDGNGDGVVACDSGALEYGYASLPVTVRTTPFWKIVGILDLSRQNVLPVSVFSTETFDSTSILVDTIDVEGLDEAALHGPTLIDANRDGYLDIAVLYLLDYMDPLTCGCYDQRFEAMTDDGRLVSGQLRYKVVGCTP